MYAPWYDAIRGFFGRAKHEGKPVPVVFASPDRALEEFARYMQRVSTQTLQAISDRPSARPFMSVWITPPRFDWQFNNQARVVVSKDEATLTAKVMRHPRAMRADVQVDLMCGAEHHVAEQISGQIDLQMVGGDHVVLPVDWADARWYRPPFNVLEHAKVLGVTGIKLTGEGFTDTSDIEENAGTKEVRRTWSGHVQGCIPYPPEEARLAREIVYALYDNADPVNPAALLSEVMGEED